MRIRRRLTEGRLPGYWTGGRGLPRHTLLILGNSSLFVDRLIVIYRFLNFELDDSKLQLRRDDAVVAVEPLVLALIIYLVENRSRTVARDELLEAVWKGVHVSDHVLSQSLYAARRLLGDTAKAPRLIKTVRGKGVEFVAAVTLDPGAAALNSPFVGRTSEMATLQSLLRDARNGRPQFALVRGEPGVGKTRLWSEFARNARELGNSVLVGRCSEAPGAPALWPWIQLVRGLRDSATARQEDQLSETADAWLRQPGQPSGVASGLEPTHFGAMDMTAELWKQAAGRIPLALVIDDLHRADEASFRQLAFLCEEMSPCPIFILAAYRASETEWPPGQFDALHRLESQATVLDVKPLDVRAAKELADKMSTAIDTARFDRIFRLSGGNPFFLTQLLSQPGSDGDPELPANAVAAANARVELLPDGCQEVLEVASVFGREFRIALLSSVLGCSENETRRNLELAAEAALIHPEVSSSGPVHFAHALVRDAIYARLGPQRKAELHCSVAKTLEKQVGGEHRSSELAHHYVAGLSLAGPESGTKHSVLAGHEALARGAFADALFHCERALSL
ncbi:MAG: AAA family ATPase, partial [bacterium]|nr:AAA family ATPase [bacterium]